MFKFIFLLIIVTEKMIGTPFYVFFFLKKKIKNYLLKK